MNTSAKKRRPAQEGSAAPGLTRLQIYTSAVSAIGVLLVVLAATRETPSWSARRVAEGISTGSPDTSGRPAYGVFACIVPRLATGFGRPFRSGENGFGLAVDGQDYRGGVLPGVCLDGRGPDCGDRKSVV